MGKKTAGSVRIENSGAGEAVGFQKREGKNGEEISCFWKVRIQKQKKASENTG